MRSSGQRKDGWWRRASTVQSPPSTSAESTAPSRMTPLLLDRSAGFASPHSAPPPLPHAAACSASLSDSTSSYSGYAGSPCGRANAGRAQRAGAEPGQPPRAPMGLWLSCCVRCVRVALSSVRVALLPQVLRELTEAGAYKALSDSLDGALARIQQREAPKLKKIPYSSTADRGSD